MQSLSILIGKKSDNSSYEIVLEQLPHLLVSYYEKVQWHRFGQHFMHQTSSQLEEREAHLFYAVRSQAQLIESSSVISLFENQGEDLSMPKQLFVQQFIAAIEHSEHKDFKQLKKGADATPTAPVRVVLIVDDLIDLLLSIRKSTAQKLIRLLYAGSGMGFCIIMASQHSRFHLVRQLQPWGKKSNKIIPELRISELVITPDDLYFFKLPEVAVHERLYDLSEGEKKS